MTTPKATELKDAIALIERAKYKEPKCAADFLEKAPDLETLIKAHETVLAAARDMMALGEAKKDASDVPVIYQESLYKPPKMDEDDHAFYVTAANLAQKWGG